MDYSNALLQQFWDSFSGWSLLLDGLLGTLLGLVCGILLAVLLQRSGWLGRRNPWHHWLLKLYFLLLPGVGLAIGVQAGIIYGVQQEAYRQVDGFKPQLQAQVDVYLEEFQTYVEAQELGAIDMREDSLRALLERLVRDYLRENPLPGFSEADDSFMQKATYRVLDGLRESALTSMVSDQLVKKMASYSRLDEDTLEQVIHARFNELFSADFVLGLAKKQIAMLMQSLYMGLLFQLLILLGLIGLEIGVSRWFGQLRPAALPAEPVPVA